MVEFEGRRSAWTRQQLLAALMLYCELPFGKLHSRNPEIIRLAAAMERTPSAVAMKLSNFASLDPAITSTHRHGLGNAAASDRALWSEMQSDWDSFVIESEEATRALGLPGSEEAIADDQPPPDYSAESKLSVSMVRVGQAFFRRAVLAAYESKCCITGLSVPKLLVASHIIPWRLDPKNRLNPQNGLCLSAIHDRAFDVGIITITEDMTVSVSTRYKVLDDRFFGDTLTTFDGKPISLPTRFQPDPTLLRFHREQVFIA